ncbi:MAG: guanine deaminase [Proteobacteria bacterium]|nr:guanine deaminase [Pseudomonadota bacterium]
MTGKTAIRGRLLDFIADPAEAGEEACYRYIADGAVVMEDGKIASIGPAADLPADMPVEDYGQALVLPGLIDTHIHYPQTRVIASYGAQLLEWLDKYTFVEEQKFADPDHAAAVAKFFFDELLRNGTTTAAVYCTVHPESVEAFFTESERLNTLMIAGKVMMDRNAPEALTDDAERSFSESAALIEKWHGRGRQHCAVTPRFAVTSTEAQLEAAGALMRGYPDIYMQTHLAENSAEIAAVAKQFPWSRSYTDVYDKFGLLGPRAIFGHGIHLSDGEIARLSETDSTVAFCPTSNLFIGSGLFDMGRLRGGGVKVGLATDVGGGTSFSMLRTAAEAYKVLQLNNQNLPALQAFHLMTRGNADALGLAGRIGTLEPGSDADITVLDTRATPAMAHRMDTIDGNLAEELFVLMTLGDDRSTLATYVAGERLYYAGR